jgi:BASS family bile acid:Na+ symporter
MVAGIALPPLAHLSPAMPWMLGAMLLLVFARLRLEHLKPRPIHMLLLMGYCVFALITFFALRPFSPTLALAGFMIALTPPSISSTAIVAILGGDVAFMTVAVTLGSLLISASLPALLTLLPIRSEPMHWQEFLVMVARVMGIIFIPFLLALAMSRLLPRLANALGQRHGLSFYIWAAIVAIVTARSAQYLHENPQPASLLLAMGCLSLILCLLHFTLGRWLGGRSHALEAGQVLGQRNTLFSIWVCQSILGSPLVALGPTFYIIWHNLYNSVQLWYHHHIPAADPADE